MLSGASGRRRNRHFPNPPTPPFFFHIPLSCQWHGVNYCPACDTSCSRLFKYLERAPSSCPLPPAGCCAAELRVRRRNCPSDARAAANPPDRRRREGGSRVYLPEQHGQQQKDEDSHQQTDGDDPADDVTPGLLTVESLEHQLKHSSALSQSHTHTCT